MLCLFWMKLTVSFWLIQPKHQGRFSEYIQSRHIQQFYSQCDTVGPQPAWGKVLRCCCTIAHRTRTFCDFPVSQHFRGKKTYHVGGLQLLPSREISYVDAVVVNALHAAFEILSTAGAWLPRERYASKGYLWEKKHINIHTVFDCKKITFTIN